MKKTFTSNIPFNKTNFFKLEQERNMLKITLQYINAENTKLKNELEDMRITARKNKEMLKEYITQITNKDKMFEKMNNQIEQLTSRLKLLENFNKLTESLENISKLSYKIDDIKVDKIILETTKNENNNFGNFENYYNDINDNYLYINQLTKGEKKYFNIFKDKIN